MRSLRLLVAAAFAIVLGAGVFVPRADAISLRLGSDGAESAMDSVSMLYATRSNGTIEPVIGAGDEVPGGTITELGNPFEMPDGRVIFGARVESPQQNQSWDMFVADPDSPAPHQVSRVLNTAKSASDCAPVLKIDPTPVAEPSGAIAFTSFTSCGGDAVFVLDGGKLTRALYDGETTNRGHAISHIALGSLQMASDRTLVVSAYLHAGAHSRSHRGLWWHNEPLSIVEVTPRGAVKEIAVEGQSAPGGGHYGVFGLPTVATGWTLGVRETFVMFTDDMPHGGNSLFISESGRTRRELARGAETSEGDLTYIGPGRPAPADDGTVAMRVGSGQRSLIVRVDSHGNVKVLAKTSSEDSSALNAMHSFGDPVFVAGSRTIFPATDSADSQGIYAADGNGTVHEVDSGPLYDVGFGTDLPARHSVAGETLSVAPDGSFCYLGGK